MAASLPTLVQALQSLARVRTNEVVITSMGTAREWPKLSRHVLDLHYVPSSMGQAPALALGIALSQPRREIVVFSGDGSLLMNLGCLATIVASGAKNLTVVLVNNGVYEVTGGQKTVAAAGRVDFPAVAKGSGFATVDAVKSLSSWDDYLARFRQLSGPRFCELSVLPERDAFHLEVPGPMSERLARFRAALLTADA